MIPLLLLIGIGVAAIYASKGSPREVSYLPQPAARPSPLVVLNQYAAAGMMPPPQVVMCAIAEATTLGRDDIAHEIQRVYVEPVAQHAAVMHARDANVASVTSAPPGAQGQAPVMSAPPPQPLPQVRPPQQAQASASMPGQVPGFAGALTNDDQIQAMLNANPQAFMAMAMQQPHVIDVPMDVPMGDVDAAPDAELLERGAVDADADISPIDGVSHDQWEGFCNKLARESENYQSSRHVGRYRQRRERLVSIGIDPNIVVGSPEAQQAAFDADMADAYGHIIGGELDRHLGRQIFLPSGEPAVITLSGILGVVQYAGLENGASWLMNRDDRKRYRHTTEAFVKTNGLF